MGFDAASMGDDFGDPLEQASATRRQCAVFNFSFLGRARLEGPAALSVISRLTRRQMSDMAVGQIRYALRCDDRGHLVSDLTVWRLGEMEYEVFSGLPEDMELLQVPVEGCQASERSGSAVIALQGPKALEALTRVADVSAVARLNYFECCRAVIGDCDCLVGRLGYTGEAGFEIISSNPGALQSLWPLLTSVARPAGYRAADILRIEAGFALFAQEFALPVFPADVAMTKYATGVQRSAHGLRLVSFLADGLEKGQPWKPSAELRPPADRAALVVTSACFSPLADRVLGLGFVHAGENNGSRQFIDSNGQFSNISLVSCPFYDPEKRKPRMKWC